MIAYFFTPIKTSPKLFLANYLFHKLWNDLSTIARYRKSSIGKNQIPL